MATYEAAIAAFDPIHPFISIGQASADAIEAAVANATMYDRLVAPRRDDGRRARGPGATAGVPPRGRPLLPE